MEEVCAFTSIKEEEKEETKQQLQEKYEENEHRRNLVQYDIAEINGDRFTNPTRDKNGNVVEQQWKMYLYALIIV